MLSVATNDTTKVLIYSLESILTISSLIVPSSSVSVDILRAFSAHSFALLRSFCFMYTCAIRYAFFFHVPGEISSHLSRYSRASWYEDSGGVPNKRAAVLRSSQDKSAIAMHPTKTSALVLHPLDCLHLPNRWYVVERFGSSCSDFSQCFLILYELAIDDLEPS
ncbi:unnamed protein product [Albugo candida]|uniref:Uncharacterized protein n=1 Tax=Albugo candida TaxID=65357 RepID=A0A024G232_9STRA|nr:unnamed protein product [Albugo candida]|eukprot:CCI40363.1 unnamed protein product [Albugo candida]